MQRVHSARVGDVERVRAAGPTMCEVRDNMTRSMSWRLGRGASVMLVLLASLALAGGEALAATQVHHSGHDRCLLLPRTRPAPPAPQCVYQGTAGPFGVRSRPGQGTQGVLAWLDRRVPQRHRRLAADAPALGRPRMGHRAHHAPRLVASRPRTHAAPLSTRNVAWAAPHDRKYRVEVKVRWMTPDAETIGSVLVSIDHLKRDYDGSVGAACKASVPTV